MLGIDDAITAGSKLIDDFITTAFPTPEAKASALAIQLKSTTDAFMDKFKAQTAIMLAEASSQDKWTSRARTSFLYVMYMLILTSIPFSVLFAFRPDIAKDVVEGFHSWLAALPDDFMSTFKTVMFGYFAHDVAKDYVKNKT